MNDDKWNDLIDSLEAKFGKIERSITKKTDKSFSGQDIDTITEQVDFSSPMGNLRVMRVTRPKVLDKKVHYSHTSSSRGNTEYVYSEDEKSYQVKLFKKSEIGNEWNEIEVGSRGLPF
jgi:hypothetical protein